MPHAPCSNLSVLFRCDGSPEIGLGHIVRCLALADELHDVHNCRITFAIRTGPLGIQMVEKKGYKVIVPQVNEQTFDYGNWLNECVRKVDAQAIVFDVRDGLRRVVVKELRNNRTLVVTIDDPENKRLEVDLAFYPPVPQVKRIDWTGFTGKLYVGWEWVILRKEFSHEAVSKTSTLLAPCAVLSAPCPMPHAPCSDLHAPCSVPHAPKVLVTMGGSDPAGLTLKAVKALEMHDEDFEVVVVLGAGFQRKKELDNLLSGCKHQFNVRENVQNMAELMVQCDLAIASFGVTAYELAAMSVPAVYLCLTEDHVESASALVEEGMAVSLGVSGCVSIKTLADKVRCLLKNTSKRLRMSTVQKINGSGAERIANLITKKLESVQSLTGRAF